MFYKGLVLCFWLIIGTIVMSFVFATEIASHDKDFYKEVDGKKGNEDEDDES